MSDKENEYNPNPQGLPLETLHFTDAHGKTQVVRQLGAAPDPNPHPLKNKSQPLLAGGRNAQTEGTYSPPQ